MPGREPARAEVVPTVEATTAQLPRLNESRTTERAEPALSLSPANQSNSRGATSCRIAATSRCPYDPDVVSKADPGSLLDWTVRLRWGLVAVLAAALPVSAGPLGLAVAWFVALPAIGALVLANLALAWRVRRGAPFGPRTAAAGALFDMAAVTIVIAAAGGAANPFTALLFVHVALAASMMPSRTAFLVAAFGAASFGALFALPGDPTCHIPGEGSFTAHLYGMWAAYAVGAVLVTLVSTELRRSLEARAKQVEALRADAESASRFAAVGTLAAGAAHELGTPLGTIAVLAGELDDEALPPAAREQARAIKVQIDRCRDVIRRMQPGAMPRAQTHNGANVGETVGEAVKAWRRAHPDATVTLQCAATARVGLAREDLAAAVDVLLDNAWHSTRAARSQSPIAVTIEESRDEAIVRVRDGGAGLDVASAARLGEPFVSSKAPGEGMGLGLFIVRSFLAEAGGRIVATPNAAGADVALHLRASFAGEASSS